MRIAFINYLNEGPDTLKNFYWSGWRTAFKGHEVNYFTYGREALARADGGYDLCFVAPGAFNLNLDCHRKRSSATKYVLVSEEDMHTPVEHLRCAADYYDHLFLFSETNVEALRGLGVPNVHQMLPCYDPEVFSFQDVEQTVDVAFLGQYDVLFKIQGHTRWEYLEALEADPGIKRFVGMGFYAGNANNVYNKSRMCLDLPTTSTVGPRAFQAGVTGAAVVMPGNNMYSKLWRKTFHVGEHYLEFHGGPDGMMRLLRNPPANLREISANMRARLAEHTFENRFNQILETIS